MSKRPSDSKPPAKIRKNYLDRTKQHADSLAAANNKSAPKKSTAKKRVPTPILPPVADTSRKK